MTARRSPADPGARLDPSTWTMTDHDATCPTCGTPAHTVTTLDEARRTTAAWCEDWRHDDFRFIWHLPGPHGPGDRPAS